MSEMTRMSPRYEAGPTSPDGHGTLDRVEPEYPEFPEFVDPGPEQPPYGPAAWPPPGPVPEPPSGPAGRREVTGLLIMLVAAALLPLVAATQSVYTVTEFGAVARAEFSVDAWGNFSPEAASYPVAHAPRFGILLLAATAGFVLLAVVAAGLLRERSARPATAAAGVAGAAAGLVGLLIGTVGAMTLEIQSAFDTYRVGFEGPVQVRLRIGGAVWLTAAAMVAGVLAVAAAVRVRRSVTVLPRSPH
jgi:hypothetical protein